MDPNANLARMRELADRLVRNGDKRTAIARHDGLELAEHVQAMDEWLVKGGFLPQAWAENCDFDRQMRDQHLRNRHIVQARSRERGEA